MKGRENGSERKAEKFMKFVYQQSCASISISGGTRIIARKETLAKRPAQWLKLNAISSLGRLCTREVDN